MSSIADSARELVLVELRSRPMTSDRLYERLLRHGVSKTAASTAVQRLVVAGSIRRSTLRLKHGRTILFHPAAPPDRRLLTELLQTGFGGRSSFVDLLTCLGDTHPAISAADVAKVLRLELGRFPALEGVLDTCRSTMEGFAELELVEPGRPVAGIPYWLAKDDALEACSLLRRRPRPRSMASTLLSERLGLALTKTTAEWLWKNGLVSENGTQHRTSERVVVNVAGMPFDLLGHSFLPALRSGRKSRIVTGDVLVGTCNAAYATSFLHRFDAVASRSRAPAFAFILAQFFPEDAFKILKKHGVLPWTHRQFLNKGTADAIETVLKLAQNFSSAAEMEPQAFEHALEGAREYGEIFGHIKGSMFELLVAHLLKKTGAERVDLGWIVQDDREQFDVDVLALRGTIADIVECKGQREDRPVAFTEFCRHVERRVPVAREALLGGTGPNKPTKFRALLVATCPVEQTPQPGGRGEPKVRPDTTVDVWDRAKLLEVSRDAQQSHLVHLIERYYSVEKPERGATRPAIAEPRAHTEGPAPLTDAHRP